MDIPEKLKEIPERFKITKSFILKRYSYNKETGEFFNKTTSGGMKIGSLAGTKTRHGYIRMRIGIKSYAAHKLVWLVHNGYIPKCLDHINRIRWDNRIENLREATAQQNSAHKITKSKLGIRGVQKRHNKYAAFISNTTNKVIKRKYLYLGTFETAYDAAKAYNIAAKKIHGNFAVLNDLKALEKYNEVMK